MINGVAATRTLATWCFGGSLSEHYVVCILVVAIDCENLRRGPAKALRLFCFASCLQPTFLCLCRPVWPFELAKMLFKLLLLSEELLERRSLLYTAWSLKKRSMSL